MQVPLSEWQINWIREKTFIEKRKKHTQIAWNCNFKKESKSKFSLRYIVSQASKWRFFQVVKCYWPHSHRSHCMCIVCWWSFCVRSTVAGHKRGQRIFYQRLKSNMVCARFLFFSLIYCFKIRISEEKPLRTLTIQPIRTLFYLFQFFSVLCGFLLQK